MEYKFQHGVVGGTFDKLHEGHKQFLRYAFSHAKVVYVTITSDAYTKIHKPDAAPFLERERHVHNFLKKEGLLQRAKLFPIDDVYGITPNNEIQLDVIFVTKDSLSGAEKVNTKRIEYGLPALPIEIIPMTQSEIGLPISATWIRKKVFNEKGQLLLKREFLETLLLPEKLREILQKPFGTVLKDVSKNTIQQNTKLIAVGDVTTRILHEIGVPPALSIIDFMVERKKQQHSLQDLGFKKNEIIFRIKNPPGVITRDLWGAIEKSLQKIEKGEKVVIIINGEEDLAALPTLLLAPEGYAICYGQPHSGMVCVPVRKDTKEYALQLILSFVPSTTRGH